MRSTATYQRRKNSVLRHLFKKIDTNDNGLISRNELQLYINACNIFEEKEGCTEQILEAFDENQDGYIDFSEFRHILSSVQRLAEKPPTNQELMYAFEQFDTDGNNLVCYRQFWKQIKSIDPSISRKEAELIFNDIDEDKDGCIDFGEFMRYLDFPQS